MLETGQHFIPVITSEAGSCLTAANWQEVQITAGAYNLESLLLKPGYELLEHISDLGQYLNWTGPIVLNASHFIANKEGIFTLISPYDGSKTKFNYSQLLAIIQQLKPDAVLLPCKTLRDFPDVWMQWNKLIKPYIAADDRIPNEMPKDYGIYFHIDNADMVNLEQLNRWSHVSRYVKGAINPNLIQHLKHIGIDFIESNEPAYLALQGIVLSANGEINLADDVVNQDFKMIDEMCTCPTCSQQLTQAYLHHLYLHTPLLCQRFLIQHNIHYIQNKVKLI
jgi:queuine tRNA-ribosyltransferase